jgi:FMN reductase
VLFAECVQAQRHSAASLTPYRKNIRLPLDPHLGAQPIARLTGFANASLRGSTDAITGADGLIAVTPVFSASYSGLFKTFFDVLDKESLTGTPVLLGATAGTARHSLVVEHAMRPLFAYLRAIAVPTGVFAAPEDWGGDGGVDRALAGRIERAAGELADLIAGRPSATPADPFEGPFGGTPSFEALLRGV